MQERTEAVRAAIDDIRRIEETLGVTRAGVEAIRDRLVELADRRELFPLDDFPPPEAEASTSSIMYRIAQDDDDRYALYAQASNGSVVTPPHNHTTWAVVVGFSGQELNKFYARADDGVVQTDEHMVEAGTGVAMLPDDLHSIHIDSPALNFHCYGRALERLDEREYYNATEGRWKTFSSTGTIVEARPDLQRC